MDKYHYTRCGLDNVWLLDGFHQEETPYGSTVSIEDIEGLHKAISQVLCEKPGILTGKEFRFLRHELEFSQETVGKLMGGKTAQAVAKWEKNNNVPEYADILIRLICKETRDGRQSYIDMVNHLNSLDRAQYEKELAFKETGEGWRKAS